MTRLGTTLSILAALLLSNVLAQGGSCSGGGAAARKGESVATNETLAAGVWGGAHARMEVVEGGVNFEFDCAAGQINRPVALDGEGRFDVKGTFNAQHAGPVLRDEEANARAARYSGRVRGETLTLTVTLAGAEEEVSSYTLTRGDEGRLTKCH
jgi:hypothetical protein